MRYWPAGAFGAAPSPPPASMALAQRLGEREGAVGGAGDGQALDRADGDERGQRLVVAQPSARLGVKMHRRATIRPTEAGRRSRASVRRRGPLRRLGSR